MMVMAFIGAFTALFAATIAVAQNDIKRVLAYSTISQLGFMIAALGIGAYVAAAFHLVTHAFFKALLFLGSGSVIHGMEHGVLHTGEHVDPQDMFNMGGLRKKMPVTFWTFLIGGLALSGFPLVTAGFWSKDEILADAFGHGHWIGLRHPGAGGPADRLLHHAPDHADLPGRAAHRSRRARPRDALDDDPAAGGPGGLCRRGSAGWASPKHFPGLGGLLPNWFHEFVGGTLLEHPEAMAFNLVPLLTSLVVALGGLCLGWLVYRNVTAGQHDPLQEALAGRSTRCCKNKYYFDELYDCHLRPPGQLDGGDLHLPVDGPQRDRWHPARGGQRRPAAWARSSATTSTSRSSTALAIWWAKAPSEFGREPAQ